ncbi:MAG: hydantoinase B/oxoprolinase family protein [Alphaproteobacteria bacterium]|nr:hydantoinase B/oxoprolinase family protein [Alphaproteobacteria bacterium]
MSSDIDPITFAVIKNGLDTIVDDMAYTVMRTARSPIVRDVLDYSATICDARGRILAQAKTVALHLGAVPDAIVAVLGEFGDELSDGDIIILNDPYAGGMHLPDIFMFKPIFHAQALQGFAVVIAHHSDVGGRVPGSNASDSTEIFQEGLRIPPLKLYAAGQADRSLFALLRNNVRLPDMLIGDLAAQVATCNVGERAFIALLKKHGADGLEHYFNALLDYGEQMTRQAIRAWPNGRYSFTDYIDDDGIDDGPIAIVCAIDVMDDHLYVDFEGSSPQVKGAINCTLSYTKSSTYIGVRCALGREVPNNAGIYRCITITAPEGSILNPRMPGAVAARALTGYRVVDAVLGALAEIAPERVMAAGEGGNTVVCIGGYEAGDQTPFILVDMINGAWGGRARKDGIEGVTNPSQNMSNMPVETLEARYPIRMEAYGLRQDSCGPGEYRGGLGLVRQYRLLAEEAVLQLRADRTDIAPYGLFGGGRAAPSRNILDPQGTAVELPGKVTRTLRRDEVIRHEQAGGGGYGDPLCRDPGLVARDVVDEKISPAFAEDHFGVILMPDGLQPDLAATEACRRQRRQD